MPFERISSVRITPDNNTVLQNLGLLGDLAGTWRGHGFNLIARPNFEGKQNLYLQLNRTEESLIVDPIGSSIPNRGFGQTDIELFGLTYLQKISDAATGGALHIEPGIWTTQPNTTYPPESATAGSQIVSRMGSIPHGNSLLAQGVASPFQGPPTIATSTANYAFSAFPSFNSTPFPVPAQPAAPVLNAAGSSEKLSAPAPPGFQEYDLTVPESANNPRTPFGTTDPPLPVDIDGVPMQTLVNDPIALLQAHIDDQIDKGYSFEGTAINIATTASLTFFQNPNSKPGDPIVTAGPGNTNGAGGTENILFLEGGDPVGAQGANADTAVVYATFWVEKVSHPDHPTFMQLQYAQAVVLDFPIFSALPTVVPLGWPHISVATLKKSFN